MISPDKIEAIYAAIPFTSEQADVECRAFKMAVMARIRAITTSNTPLNKLDHMITDNSPGNGRLTPLQKAAINALPVEVAALIFLGVDVDRCTPLSCHQENALMLMVRIKQHASYLTEGHLKIAAMLIAAGVDLSQERSDNGNTAVDLLEHRSQCQLNRQHKIERRPPANRTTAEQNTLMQLYAERPIIDNMLTMLTTAHKIQLANAVSMRTLRQHTLEEQILKQQILINELEIACVEQEIARIAQLRRGLSFRNHTAQNAVPEFNEDADEDDDNDMRCGT